LQTKQLGEDWTTKAHFENCKAYQKEFEGVTRELDVGIALLYLKPTSKKSTVNSEKFESSWG